MAAETSNATSYADVALSFPAGLLSRVHKEESSDALEELNDILRFFRMPDGATISWWRMWISDVDTGGSPTVTHSLDLTDGTTTHALLVNKTIGRTAGLAEPSSAAEVALLGTKLDTDDFVVQIKTTAAPATAATGDFYVAIYYTMQP